jgi:hypothetical protein
LIGLDVTTQGGVPAVINTPAGDLQLVATIYPLTANQSVQWSIIPVTGLAYINTSGLVTAATDGTVWAKAVAAQDVTMADSILITISNQIPIPPAVITQPATNIALNDARLNGSVNANNYSSSVSFEWGLTTSYGNTATANPALVTGNSTIAVLADLSGLSSGTTYHFRCKATNAGGTMYGQDLVFTTQCLLAGTMSAITGPAELCAGSTGQVYSVAPFPGATSYIWTLPPGATIVAGNNTNVITVDYSPNALPGDMSVYATDGLCNSLPSPTLSINVIPLPVQAGNITGLQLICEGSTGIEYSITPIPGVTTYQWSVPPGAVITSGVTTNSITVDYPLGSTSGNIVVYGTNSCGTGAPSAPLPISIMLLPATPGNISGPDHVCTEAFNVSYSVSPVTNAYSYYWSLPAGAEITSGANTNQIMVHFSLSAVSGNITVYGTNGNCSGPTSAPLYVTVNPIPASPFITRQGDTLTSSAPSGNQWYRDGNVIPNATGQQYIATIPGDYSVIVTLNGCSSAISNVITVLPVSLNENPRTSHQVLYPNPTAGKLFIRIPDNMNDFAKVEIYNSIGVKMNIPEPVREKGSNELSVNLADLPSGLYMVSIKGKDNTFSSKIYVRD